MGGMDSPTMAHLWGEILYSSEKETKDRPHKHNVEKKKQDAERVYSRHPSTSILTTSKPRSS